MEIQVVLVRPQHPGNIGSVARVMANFGLKDLTLIKASPDNKSMTLAMHAKSILESCKTINSLDQVEADLLVATTAKRANEYNLKRNFFSADKFGEFVSQHGGKIAIVFGPEDIGLTNEELELCDMTVSILSDEKYPTLNLSHAAGIIFYELFKANYDEKRDSLAKKEDLKILYQTSDEFVDSLKIRRRHVFDELLRRIWGRAGLTGREVHGVIGLLKRAMNGAQNK